MPPDYPFLAYNASCVFADFSVSSPPAFQLGSLTPVFFIRGPSFFGNWSTVCCFMVLLVVREVTVFSFVHREDLCAYQHSHVWKVIVKCLTDYCPLLPQRSIHAEISRSEKTAPRVLATQNPNHKG